MKHHTDNQNSQSNTKKEQESILLKSWSCSKVEHNWHDQRYWSNPLRCCEAHFSLTYLISWLLFIKILNWFINEKSIIKKNILSDFVCYCSINIFKWILENTKPCPYSLTFKNLQKIRVWSNNLKQEVSYVSYQEKIILSVKLNKINNVNKSQ